MKSMYRILLIYIEDRGKKYLFWGSFRGIYGIELSNDGLSVKKGAKLHQVAGTAYEGTYIHKKDDYYYFFASIGTCCEGLKSTYCRSFKETFWTLCG